MRPYNPVLTADPSLRSRAGLRPRWGGLCLPQYLDDLLLAVTSLHSPSPCWGLLLDSHFNWSSFWGAGQRKRYTGKPWPAWGRGILRYGRTAQGPILGPLTAGVDQTSQPHKQGATANTEAR